MPRPRRNLPLAAYPGEYRLLLLDGHHSHYNLRICKYAWDNKIILVSDSGHSTHLLQRLDVGLFALLQKAYRQRYGLEINYKLSLANHLAAVSYHHHF